MKMKHAPCKECDKRELHCHDRCMNYMQWKREWNRSKLQKKKEKHSPYNEYRSESIERRERKYKQ